MKKVFTVLLLLLFPALLNAQWSEQTSNVTATLTSVYAVNSFTAWTCGYSSTVLKTTNAGINWKKVDGDGYNGIPGNVNLENIFAFDTSTAIVSGYQGTNTWVWKTTNSGQNWNEVFYQYNGFVDGVCMLSQTNGILIGDPVSGRWSLWKTTNAGNTWDSTGMYLPAGSISEGGYNNSFFGISPKIWFGTNNTRVYYSSNSGANWSVQSINPDVNSYSLWFSQNYEGLSGGANLMQTTNNGLNWTSFNSIGSGDIGGITSLNIPVDFPVNNIWFVRMLSSSIYATFNGGTNWISEYTTTRGTYRHISNAKLGYGIWAVGTNGCITYHTVISGINSVSSLIPNKFYLSQNYPNPFNPATKIRFDIPSNGFPIKAFGNDRVVLKIYDILGKEITTLVNESLTPGTYEVTFNASQYPSGVYFYRITTDGYSETKKMILMK